jgi:thymidylate synthase (FAD)
MNDNVISFEQFEKFRVEIVKPPMGKVYLVDSMRNPELTVARLCEGYEGIYGDLYFPTEKEIAKAFDDVKRTKLQTPMEMIYTVWLITGVTRAFTHQLVRTRLASYVQESMRFMGHKGVYQILATGAVARNDDDNVYDDAILNSIRAYEKLLEDGIPAEDARGVLPTNILTSIYVGIPLNSLMHIYEQRVCCQAQQGEWVPILQQMKELLRTEVSEKVAGLLTAPYERGEPCGYNASFDRPCTWRKDSHG